MQARWRFALTVAVLAALMTGPFVLTAVMIWADPPAETRSALHVLADRWLPLGVLTTLAGFAVGIALLGRLFRHYVQGLLRMAEGQWPHLDFMTPIGVLAMALQQFGHRHVLR